jgi:general secretion pathway protein B
MSFILDALKKSETERQRADSPALYEVKKAPPRQRVATWLIVLAGLLIINVAVLAMVLLRGGHGAPPATDANTAAPPPAAAAATTVVMPAPAAATPTVVMPPPVADAPAADFAGSAPADVVTRQSDDDAPAVEPPAAAAPSGQRGRLVRELGTGVGEVPSYDQLASVPGANLPELKLDLHAYAPNPADRFIFLNMVKLQEGQTSPQGVRVETITPDGAILSWQGSRFLLQRQ